MACFNFFSGEMEVAMVEEFMVVDGPVKFGEDLVSAIAHVT